MAISHSPPLTSGGGHDPAFSSTISPTISASTTSHAFSCVLCWQPFPLPWFARGRLPNNGDITLVNPCLTRR